MEAAVSTIAPTFPSGADRVRPLPTSWLVPASRGETAMPDRWMPESLRANGEEQATPVSFPVSYELAGFPGDPLVVVMGGISANRHACANQADPGPGWWRDLAGPDKAIDPRGCRILGVDFLAGPEPDTDSPAESARKFKVTPGDQADAVAAVLDHLGEGAIHRFVGASYGGMVALEFAVRYPPRVGGVVAVAAAHRPHPLGAGIRAVQRAVVDLAAAGDREADGVALARALAFTTYKTSAGLDSRFSPENIESYLMGKGREFADRTSGRAFNTLTRSIDLGAIRPEDVSVPVSVIAWKEDLNVPLWLVEELVSRLPSVESVNILSSDAGHDAFLLGSGAYSAALQAAVGLGAPRSSPARGVKAPHNLVADDVATAAVRTGVAADPAYGAVMPPLYLSSNFQFQGIGTEPEYDYTRSANPTRDHLCAALARLENGTGAVATSSGMSAVSVVLSLVGADELVLAPHDCYGGTHRLLTGLDRAGRLRARFIDFTEPGRLREELSRGPRMVWVETPSNPLLRITDLAKTARLARRIGAITVADNTFLSPALQRPIDHGFDLAVHSTTKFINGHSDVVGGAVVAADRGLLEEVAWWANASGASQSPFDSFLTLRGVRTLHARVRQHEENAAAVADLLAGHPAVARVFYPGLPGHPGHEIAKQQQEGFGSILSFDLKGGREAARGLTDRLKLFILAESLGGVESLVCHPDTMTHAAMDPAARRQAGITGGMLRLSVGIESTRDILSDLESSLDAC